MNLIHVIFCAAFCFASGSAGNLGPAVTKVSIGFIDQDIHSLTSDDIKATNNVIGLLEYIRELMPVGINIILPPTDPFVSEWLGELVFNDSQSMLQGLVTLSELVVFGARKFTINNLEVRIDNSRIDFDITVPSVVADLNYKADNFHYGSFVLSTSGHTQITLEDLKLTGALGLEQEYTDSDETNLAVIGLQVKSDVGNIKIDKETIAIQQEVINEVIDNIASCLAEEAIDQLGIILRHFTIEQVLQFLLP